MEKLPIEMWEKIFDNLLDSEDCMNTSKAFPLWDHILLPVKSSWLFSQTFPLILKYLSISDILHCRLVCCRWGYGVDQFLENNILHQPIRKLEKSKNVQYVNYDDPLEPLYSVLDGTLSESRSTTLIYTNIKGPIKRQKILLETFKSSRCPFIGKSVYIYESARDSVLSPSTELLQLHGHHVKTMVIDLGNRTYFRFLDQPDSLSQFTKSLGIQRIIELCKLVPNLRKLEIKGRIANRQSTEENNATNKELENIREAVVMKTDNFLPKLESIDVNVRGVYEADFGETLFTIFKTSKLNYMKLRGLEIQEKIIPKNLTDLNLKMTSDEEMLKLYNLTCNLRHLHLEYESYSEIDSNILFKVLCKFKTSLCSFGFKYSLQQYGCGWLMNQSKEQRYIITNEKAQKQLGFSDPEILVQLSNVRELSLEGKIPPSLNFLCGISESMENLHIEVAESRFQRNRAKKSDIVEDEWNDNVDLLQVLNELRFSTEVSLYDSNVWEVFPKLKVISLFTHTPYLKRNYRRDIYDKIQYKMKLAEEQQNISKAGEVGKDQSDKKGKHFLNSILPKFLLKRLSEPNVLL